MGGSLAVQRFRDIVRVVVNKSADKLREASCHNAMTETTFKQILKHGIVEYDRKEARRQLIWKYMFTVDYNARNQMIYNHARDTMGKIYAAIAEAWVEYEKAVRAIVQVPMDRSDVMVPMKEGQLYTYAEKKHMAAFEAEVARRLADPQKFAIYASSQPKIRTLVRTDNFLTLRTQFISGGGFMKVVN